MSDVRPVRRALLTVYDKTGVAELGARLVELGATLVSSGGTAQALRDAGLPVTPVEEVTAFPEMLGGRVKTLHPKIHGGLLADRRRAEHVEELAEHGIEPFDLLVSNLYPFRETVASGADLEEVIEKIDIGGPAMVRAAAKNFASVGVVVDPARYDEIVAEIEREGGLTLETRRASAAAAFAHTAAYDAAVAGWFAQLDAGESLPSFVGAAYEKVGDLRYGENPHQRGALYAEAGGPGVLGGAKVLQGKEMSFNNWLDVDAAYTLASALPPNAAVIVKHNNPCGAALGATPAEAYTKAFACDTVSAFGGIVAFHAPCDEDAAARDGRRLHGGRRRAGVHRRRAGCVRRAAEPARGAGAARDRWRVGRASDPRGCAGAGPRPGRRGDRGAAEGLGGRRRRASRPIEEWRDLTFAWTVAWRVKSNAIVFAKDGATVGVGAGQMSRVDAAWIAVRKADGRAEGASMASDAFFPFPDAIEVAADAGVTAVAHPGGSMRDEDTLAAAQARGMAVVITGRRHFRH